MYASESVNELLGRLLHRVRRVCDVLDGLLELGLLHPLGEKVRRVLLVVDVTHDDVPAGYTLLNADVSLEVMPRARCRPLPTRDALVGRVVRGDQQGPSSIPPTERPSQAPMPAHAFPGSHQSSMWGDLHAPSPLRFGHDSQCLLSLSRCWSPH